MADTQEPESDDPELDAMIRKLRKGRAGTALMVSAMIAGSLGLLAFLLHLTFIAGRDSATRALEKPPVEEVPVTFTVVDDLPWEVRMRPELFTVANQTVAIRTAVPDTDDAWYYGTGFVVSDGLVVSAAHIVPHATSNVSFPVLVTCNGREIDGGVMAYDDVRDVMAVFAPGCTGTDLVFDDRRLTTRDILHVSGYMFSPSKPLAARYFRNSSYIPGAMIGETEERVEPDLLERVREMRRLRVPRFRAIAGAAIPGNSGSPVFDDQGRVVGMLVARDSSRNRSFMVPARTIQRVLRTYGLP